MHGTPPRTYKKLPAGVRCRCIELWIDNDGIAYCCKGEAISDNRMADDDKRAEVGSYYVDQFARAMNAVGEQFYAHRDQLLFEIECLRKEVAELRALNERYAAEIDNS